MATLALGAAGAAIGGAVLPGFSLLGTTVTGAAIGQAVGAAAGSFVDQALFGASGQSRIVEGPRLASLQVMASSEGSPIPRLYGRARLAGQMIWATRLEEVAVQTTEQPKSGGKGLGGSASASTTTQIEYRYYANFALGLCEGPITRIGRVWADGKELALAGYTYRVHTGTETQQPDSLILAKQGAANAPAYRGLAYIVFERMPLERFGNRIPQLSIEVFRAVDGFEKVVKSITIIPAAGEFAYEKTRVLRDVGFGEALPENVHTHAGGTDWTVSIRELQDELPNLDRASLVVAWFGTDLRAGHCELRPGVESATKITMPLTWGVGGVTRAFAHVVSEHDGRPAYGGTPSDQSVVSAIQDLKARGLGVTFYPFVLMDVPQGNSLPDPYGGAAQAAYPWRGRITLDKAPGVAGTPDKTAAAASEIAAFVGAASPSDFNIVGETVGYSGPAEWSYRRMILHYAHLCKAAGGVDAFLIGSEMRGLTTARSATSVFPFVTALVQLAADVKAVLGPGTKVSYAADWSEYFGHQPQDGTGDVHFHLDTLWSSTHIDAVGIDVYWPLSDWRDGDSHRDRAVAEDAHDLTYLKSNIFGGEGYDWYYASDAHRDAQTRTTITDGVGKPWVFRFKDIRSWWQSYHYNRPGGTESASHTGWVPQSKPFWFTETGCPAVDKGSNQPNVFYDPKSSESHLPYYSLGVRDDLIQRRYIQALNEFFDPAHAAYVSGSNPVSSVYGGRMVERSRITAYTWDARPYPAFPLATDVWADGGNWELGHWLTGRLGGGSLAAIIAVILEDYGFTRYSTAALTGTLDGYVIDRILSARQVLQPLELAYFVDAVESAGLMRFQPRGRSGVVAALTPDDLVERASDAEAFELTRAQETELPRASKVLFIDGNAAYASAAADSRRLVVASDRVSAADLPMVLGPGRARAIAEAWLQESWSARTRASLALPPSRLGLEPGDVVRLEADGGSQQLRITGITEGLFKEIEALSFQGAIYAPQAAPGRDTPPDLPRVFGPSTSAFLDLPRLAAGDSDHDGYLAAGQAPWPGAVAFHRSVDGASFTLRALARTRAVMGMTLNVLPKGPEWVWDEGARLEVQLDFGELASVSEAQLFASANALAIETGSHAWEIIQFQIAELIGTRRYRLSRLLRGVLGTEWAMSASLAAGARVVLIDGALTQAGLLRGDVGAEFLWRYGPAPYPIDDASYQQRSHAFQGIGLKPLSPVHVTAMRAAGDCTISWIRRTRVDGDGWEVVEVPLGEDVEAYEVDILDGATVKRTLAVSTQSAVYTAAEQSSDWGTPPASYAVRVYQLSSTYGRGAPREAVV